MKLSLLAPFIFAISLSTHAANTDHPRKPSGSSPAAKKGSSTYVSVPFDVTTDKLPAHYQGHGIFDILKALTPPKARGEFEKSEEYDARLTRWKETPYLGTITPADVLAFEVTDFLAPDALSIKYDADKEEMTAKISFEQRYFDSGDARWLETFYQSKNLGSQMGITRMGVKFRVTSYLGTSVGLGVKEKIAPISISTPLLRDEALRVKRAIRVFAITNLAEPYKINDSTSSTASLDRPSEWLTRYFGLWVNLKAIWLVNVITGDVIAKVEAPFAGCTYGIC